MKCDENKIQSYSFQTWSLIDVVVYTDKNECTATPGICGTGGTCANIDGSYTCTCDSGVGGGDGIPCSGKNEVYKLLIEM